MTCFRILVFLIINDSVNFQNQWSQVQFATTSPTYPPPRYVLFEQRVFVGYSSKVF